MNVGFLQDLRRQYELVGARYEERTGRPPIPCDPTAPQAIADALQRMSSVLNNRIELDAGPPVRWDVVEIRLDGVSAHAQLEARDAAGLRAGVSLAVLNDAEGPIADAVAVVWREAEKRARGLCPR